MPIFIDRGAPLRNKTGHAKTRRFCARSGDERAQEFALGPHDANFFRVDFDSLSECAQVGVSLTRMCMWAQEIGLLDGNALNGALPFADIAKETNLPVTKINSPFGEITYLPSIIDMPDIKPGFVRGPQPLGSSLLQWQD